MESIETLNQWLIDHFGKDSDTGQPMFRIVWANDQLEKRLMEVTDLGVYLIRPEIREVKKYSYLKDVYVLERLVAVPEVNLRELAGVKLSYEPIWVYRDAERNPLPPIWPATKLVIDALFAALGKSSLVKYIEPSHETDVARLQEELFGNETETGDAMTYGEAIVVPQNYTKDRKES